MISYELSAQRLPMIEEIDIAQLVRDRNDAGEPQPLSQVAEKLGLDPTAYR
ncbi:hypothetical protein [Paramicrobacterium fandaimingii]|uniref:hypothetical protein n=1 Tax=Paramicrobacterium fandaimingii TaxID=2708079 RepID=UPI00189CE8C6|nr:hypothetical protein [Microbacterium fandaimingii]